MNRPARIALGAWLLLAAVGTEAEEPDAPRDLPPLESGLVERTGRSVFLLDVELADADGRPMPGLDAGDFVLELNGRDYPIYSVDDLCTAESAGPPTGGTTGKHERPAAPREPVRTVLYLDFSELRPDGRALAVREAERWIRAHVRDGQEAMVAAYATIAGLQERTGFTDDPDELVAAVHAVNDDRAFLDAFPWTIDARMARCGDASRRRPRFPPECLDPVREEYSHGRHSLRALQALLERLSALPGRKTLILFTQNAHVDPVAVFLPPDPQEPAFAPDLPGYDHFRLLEEVGAEANLARTAVFTANLNDNLGQGPFAGGVLAGAASSFGATLADYTGGSYSRGQSDLRAATERAAARPACVYRIGIAPPPDARDRVFRIKVWMHDRPLAARYRVAFLDDTDRWWREARRVLDRPESARDLELTAALVPIRAGRRGWEVAVQVVVDPTALVAAPVGGRSRSDWEVGVLVSREPSGATWEMLGVSRMRRRGDEPIEALLLYERSLYRLKPGRYRIAAFVRDRLGGSFGGAESFLDLPDTAPGIVGPLVFEADRPHVTAELPLLARRGAAAPETRATGTERGAVPAAPAALPAGTPVEILTWVCPAEGETAMPEVMRYVSRDGSPLFRFEASEPRSAGTCKRIADRVETDEIGAGSFAYHVRLPRTGAENLEREVVFTVTRADPVP